MWWGSRTSSPSTPRTRRQHPRTMSGGSGGSGGTPVSLWVPGNLSVVRRGRPRGRMHAGASPAGPPPAPPAPPDRIRARRLVPSSARVADMTVMPPTWTLLVPTLGERRRLFERLMTTLVPQTDHHHGRVRVIGYLNNGRPSLPAIRQAMLTAA